MVYRLINVPVHKINYDRKLGLVLDIPEFNGFKKDLILKFIRKNRWVKNLKNIITLK